MADELNKKDDGNLIASIISSDNFINLDSNIQNNIIKSVGDNKGKDGGIMGRFLGNKPSNVSMHIALILCLSLIILIVIDMVHSYFVNENLNMDLINLIVPVVTLSLGYIFGKGNSD